MKNRIVIGIILGLFIGLFGLFITFGFKKENVPETVTEISNDYSVDGTDDTYVYATRAIGYRLYDNIGLTKAAYTAIDEALKNAGLATEEIDIDKSTYDKINNIFRYKSVEVDCSKYLDVHNFEIINSGNIGKDIEDKVRTWLSEIDASGEVELLSYDSDSGDLELIINDEKKTVTIK